MNYGKLIRQLRQDPRMWEDGPKAAQVGRMIDTAKALDERRERNEIRAWCSGRGPRPFRMGTKDYGTHPDNY